MLLSKALSKVVQNQPQEITTVFEENGVELVFSPTEGLYALKGEQKHPINNLFKAEQIFEGLLPRKEFMVPRDNMGVLFEKFDKALSLKPIIKEERIKGFEGDGVEFHKNGLIVFKEINDKNYPLIKFIQKNQIGKRC